jgi:hypothetical protein
MKHKNFQAGSGSGRISLRLHRSGSGRNINGSATLKGRAIRFQTLLAILIFYLFSQKVYLN